jgi:hypothetical protein
MCLAAGEAIISVVSDGAGSATFGGQGANSICRSIAASAKRELKDGELPTDEQVWGWVDRARDQISELAKRMDSPRREFAATLICLISTGSDTLVAHIGDGAATIRDETGSWSAASWPEQGEYASTTYFVTDDPAPRLRIVRRHGLVTAVAVFSDGIERIALDFARKEPHSPFFENMIQPVLRSEDAGRDMKLSGSLAKFLSSQRVLERTDDDKTLILAAALDQ